MALVGFSGSRSLPVSFASFVACVVAAFARSGRGVAVGCARGADALVRAGAASCGAPLSVFSVASGAFGAGRAAFARRSVALVRAVAASGAGSGFVGFVSVPCPSGVAPAPSWRSGARVSGSWSSVALAAGLGVPVVVVWCASGAPVLPSWPAGSWAPVALCGASAWRWCPASAPARLPGL